MTTRPKILAIYFLLAYRFSAAAGRAAVQPYSEAAKAHRREG